MIALRAFIAVTLLFTFGCTVKFDRSASAGSVRNQCSSAAECGTGTCSSGTCVAYQGDLSSLLIEVAPPANAAGVGGVRSLQILSGLSQPNQDTKIDLVPTTQLHGYFATDKLCPGTRSIPVQITLEPHEESYGLQAATYVAQTSLAFVGGQHPCNALAAGETVEEFVLAIPGDPNALYDVYVEPQTGTTSGDGGASSCHIVPQLHTSQQVLKPDQPSAVSCWQLYASPQPYLDVVIPWPDTAQGEDSLDGWTVDVVHPITGQVLSDRLTLRNADRGTTDAGPGYAPPHLRFAPVVTDVPGKELVRLSPPVVNGVPAGPTIQAERAALQAALGKAVFPAIGPFPSLVSVESWVYRKDSEKAAPSDVSLVAEKLEGITPGVFASYSTTASVGSDGRLAVKVLPGTYRARVVPQTGQGLAAAEVEIQAACTRDPTSTTGCATGSSTTTPPPQAGKVIYVPFAGRMNGLVESPIGDHAPLDIATVQASPASYRTLKCDPGVDASACNAQTVGVLDLSLAQDAFVPRPASGVVQESGRFELDDLDCGECSGTAGANFDVSIRPPDGTHFPWFVKPGVMVVSTKDLGTLSLPLPIIHHGVVEIPQTSAEPLPVPNALIRAYVLRDQSGAVIDTPDGLSSCQSVATTKTATKTTRCIRSVLQVAETRASPDGKFELAIPASLE